MQQVALDQTIQVMMTHENRRLGETRLQRPQKRLSVILRVIRRCYSPLQRSQVIAS